MSDTQEKLEGRLDKLIDGHAYEVYITKDLPDDKCDEEQLRLRKIYKAEFRKLIESAKREGEREGIAMAAIVLVEAGILSQDDTTRFYTLIAQLKQSEESE